MGHFPEETLLGPTPCWAILHITRAFSVPCPGLGEPGEDSYQVSAPGCRQAWTLSADRCSAGHGQRAFWNIVQGLRGRQNIAPRSSAGREERGISRAPKASLTIGEQALPALGRGGQFLICPLRSHSRGREGEGPTLGRLHVERDQRKACGSS